MILAFWPKFKHVHIIMLLADDDDDLDILLGQGLREQW